MTKSNLMNVDPTLSREHQRPDLATTLHMAEGFALVMLCHCRLTTRRIALMILKEVSFSAWQISWGARVLSDIALLLLPGEESIQRAGLLAGGMHCPRRPWPRSCYCVGRVLAPHPPVGQDSRTQHQSCPRLSMDYGWVTMTTSKFLLYTTQDF